MLLPTHGKHRQRSDTIANEPSPKKQKVAHPTQPPPTFWDNLSQIPLTGSALRELDRKNTAAAATSLRRTSGQRKLASVSIQPATQYLNCSSQIRLDKVRRSAKQGGPDLSDLRAARHYEPTVLAIDTVVATSSGMTSTSSLSRRKRGLTSPSNSISSIMAFSPTVTSSRTARHLYSRII